MSSLSPKKTIALLHYLLDGIPSLTTILIGRLLPKLKIPQVDLTNKTAIITGANSGIGYSLALLSPNKTQQSTSPAATPPKPVKQPLPSSTQQASRPTTSTSSPSTSLR